MMDTAISTETPVLEVTDLVRSYRRPDGRIVYAVDHVSFTLGQGETLGLVGESGCGKSSLARALMQLPPPNSGSVRISGEELSGLSNSERRELRRRLQEGLDMVEEKARSELGMVKPNEVYVQFTPR